MAVSAVELAAFANGGPILGGFNALKLKNNPAKWTLTGTAAGADVTAPAFDAFRAHDGRPNLPTKPTLSVVRDFYLNFDLVTIGQLVDMISGVGTNFYELAGTITLTAEYDDAGIGTFTGPNTVIAATWLPDPMDKPKRFTSFNLEGSNERITKRYWRLHVNSSIDFAVAPSISELFLGRRWQMVRPGDRPFVKVGVQNIGTGFRSSGGNSSDYIDEERVAAFSRVWSPKDYEDESGLDDSQTIRSWFRDVKGGRHAFVYCDEPSANPNQWYWMRLPIGSQRLEMVYASSPCKFDDVAIFMQEEAPPLDPEND